MELNFLTIADAPEDLQPLRSLLASFERDKQIQLSIAPCWLGPCLAGSVDGCRGGEGSTCFADRLDLGRDDGNAGRVARL